MHICVNELVHHNERNGGSNHKPRDCLLNRLFRRSRSKKTSKLRVTGLGAENSLVTGDIFDQRHIHVNEQVCFESNFTQFETRVSFINTDYLSSQHGQGSDQFICFNSNSSWIQDFSIQFNSNSNQIQNISIQFQFNSFSFNSNSIQFKFYTPW